jgi:hypothetical protein
MGYRRYIEETQSQLSSSFSGSTSQLSQSIFTQSISGSTTYTFQKNLQSMRLQITATFPSTINFLLTTQGGGASKIEKVVAWGENFSVSGSFALRNNTESRFITNGFWTGTITNGGTPANVTASLHPLVGNTIVQENSMCFVTSSQGPFTVQIFYRVQE